MKQRGVKVIGGGLAGVEAAWQCVRAGVPVTLCEMRPTVTTPAHRTGDLAELVCSNSLKSEAPGSAPRLLKDEMRALGSLVLEAAEDARVPAGQALAVDRDVMASSITRRLESSPLFTLSRGEVTAIPSDGELEAADEWWVVATGPLSSDAMARSIQALCGDDRHLAFYDAIAPVIAAESIDMKIAFAASRYGKSGDDYLNLPLNKEQYEAFIAALASADQYPLHDFEEPRFFEGCLPIEVMVDRGPETLRFGPMKPVGITDPATGRWPYAAVQLRRENVEGTMYSLVGFQTKMRRGAQERVFRLLPGLENVEFLRFGSVHRNTYIQSPKVLNPDLTFKRASRVFLAGQVSGVEGYVESAAMGILAGRAAAARAIGRTPTMPPKDCVIGGLWHYVTHGGSGEFQPMNANLGLLPGIPKQKGQSKEQRKELQASRSREVFARWLEASR